ncbi:Peptidoglycan-binding LysM:SLT:MLTD N domain protein [Azotobacter vinelandii CA]|uniref:Peptidoglycan-binding LysM:SLT:MLTD_N domain protein n=2 Tax=Azotobacter vinelandii TaxID=354 RepID=C1DM42_AZOVD|nr:transglycosylase SLT domain-containing protein [Azotobacter vinelandii]ACO79129.1 Peptidoglycan-binding LysM:SLT:MLTD_N domain protein [Azotobacter vinelandii DJ]AGK14100.1 Peptidoglycan-binding LysM:SLT:MLTD N domain protein [Azotobacter vinelandii CA]AGK20991.1 Peptidoglycan-binding LysM:SLT:MLTD N domain protein [Azotobacter vinelandii CA6]
MSKSLLGGVVPGVLARRSPLLVALLATALAGCQSTNQRPDDEYSRLVAKPKRETLWLEQAASAQPQDIWVRMREGFSLQDEIDVNPRIERQRLWFVSNPLHIDKVSERGALYMHYIVERLEERGMPLELALLPVIESAYNPLAYSRAHAVGLWQFIPSTGRDYNLHQTQWYDGRRDITASTQAAIEYLSKLHDMFNGDWLLALASYNAGEGTVSRAIERNRRLGLPTDYWNLPLPKETQDYVPKLLALSQVIMTPEAYGISLSPIANEPYFDRVEIGGSMELSRLAEMAGIDKGELLRLNPAYKRGITLDGPQYLLVPTESAERLQLSLGRTPEQLAEWRKQRLAASHGGVRPRRPELHRTFSLQQATTPPSAARLLALEEERPPRRTSVAGKKRKAVTYYKVRKGDSLHRIAQRFQVDTKTLQRWNSLSGRTIRPGQTLTLFLAN